MNEIIKMMQEHNGQIYEFTFVINGEKIIDPQNMLVAFEAVSDTPELPQSNTKLGLICAQIKVWLSKLGTAAFKGVSTSTNVSEAGKYVADAILIKNIYTEMAKKASLEATRHITVTDFTNDITGSLSIVKYGLMVIVTAALTTHSVIIAETIICADNTIPATFGIPEHDFHAALAHSTEGVLSGVVGTLSMRPDNGLRINFPRTGQYDGTLIYCVKGDQS